MAQIGTPPPVVHKRTAASSDIYTVLTLLAVLALGVGVGFVWWRGSQLFGTSNPFEIHARTTTSTGR